MPDWLRLRAPARRPQEMAARSIVIDGRALPLRLRRLSTARRLTLRLAADGSEARVTMPTWVRIGDAERFARERADWLRQQLQRVTSPEEVGSGSELHYRGRRVTVDWQPAAPRRPAVAGERIVLGGPEQGLSGRLRRWLEAEALRLCAADLADYAARAGVPVPPLRLSRARGRWGSCSPDGTIRLNWRLVMAPDAVRRSVVAHEVAHLTHFDHSPAFHAHAQHLFEGDPAAAKRWLKDEGRSLFAAFG